jgi:pimeloyl-ACP methyl ester carboxylesterase
MRIDARGWTFDVHAGGPAGGLPVVLLHGFPQDSREWAGVLPRLHAANLRTYALDQRGYSPGARPAPVRSYRLDEAVADLLAVLDALGLPGAHLVGHDWGAIVAWLAAARFPDRVRSLTAISVPHPRAMAEAFRSGGQALRLGYVGLFRLPGVAERLLMARDGAAMRAMLAPAGAEAAAGYVAAMREPGRLTAALNWYRANGFRDGLTIGAVPVPTTYVYSTGDPAVSPRAVRGTARWVGADYRLVVLRNVSHWVPEQAPAAVADVVRARVVDNV